MPNLKQVEELQDTDFMWRINVLLHKKTSKKQDMLVLIRNILVYIGQTATVI